MHNTVVATNRFRKSKISLSETLIANSKCKLFTGKELLIDTFEIDDYKLNNIIKNIQKKIEEKELEFHTNEISNHTNNDIKTILYDGKDNKVFYIDQLYNKIKDYGEVLENVVTNKDLENEKKAADNLSKLIADYKIIVKNYITNISIPYAFKKIMNVFMFYIIKFNQFKNSWFINKLQILVKSDKYISDEEVKNEINNRLQAITNESTINDFLKNNLSNLKSNNFSSIITYLNSNKLVDTDGYIEESNIATNLNIQNEGICDFIKKFYNDFSTSPKAEGEGEGEKNDLNDLNDFIFKYISKRIETLKEFTIYILNANTSVEYSEYCKYYKNETILFKNLYYIIISLGNHFQKKHNEIIELNKTEIAKTISNLFDTYSDSSVISYIKIRDGQNESSDKYKLFNPRYIYFTDEPSVVISKNSTNLSLLYCNDPGNIIQIPPLKQETDEEITLSKNDQCLDSFILDIDETIKDNKYKPIKYDHLFSYGNFNKVLYNVSNEDFGNEMNEVVDKLKNYKDVFIIGYGASGAGKTTTLIYDKIAASNKQNSDGAIVFTLNKLAKEDSKYKNL